MIMHKNILVTMQI